MATDTAPGHSAWLPALLQTADALFPTGAYAHSFGLEEMVALGVVHNEHSLRDFLTGHVLPTLETQELPYLRFAFECATDLSALCLLDRELNALKLARETREASVQIGLRRLKALLTILDTPLLADFAAAIARGEAFGHHVCACALQGKSQAAPLEAVLVAYAYGALSSGVTAALKLIRIGQEGCQRALSHAVALLPKCLDASLLVARSEAGTFSPLLEIASMRHAFARERLFIS